MAKPNADFVAQVVLDAIYDHDDRVAKRYGISKRTITNYRALVRDDDVYAAVFAHKKKLREDDWVKDIPAAIAAGLEWLRNKLPSVEATPEGVHAVAGAVKLLAEVDLTNRVITDRMNRNQPLQLPATSDKEND